MDSAQKPQSNNNQPEELKAPIPYPEISPPPALPEISSPSSVSISAPPTKKFPFMIVTVILILVVISFGGSVLYFQMTSPKKPATITPVVTPPATVPPVSPTTVAVNPFASPSASLTNPFATPTTKFENPFGTNTNPFTSATNSAKTDNKPVTNPFE